MEWKEKGVHGSIGKMKNNGFLQHLETVSFSLFDFGKVGIVNPRAYSNICIYLFIFLLKFKDLTEIQTKRFC